MPLGALQAVRLAGLWRLQPVVPDRPAFGAAIEQKTQRDYAYPKRQTPEHDTPHPATKRFYRVNLGVCKPLRTPCRGLRSPGLEIHRTISTDSRAGRGETHVGTACRGIRPCRDPPHSRRGVRAVGAGPWAVDRTAGNDVAGKCRRLAAGG